MNAEMTTRVSDRANASNSKKERHSADVRKALALAMEIIDLEARRGAYQTLTSIGYPHGIPAAAQIEACRILRDNGYRITDRCGGTVVASWGPRKYDRLSHSDWIVCAAAGSVIFLALRVLGWI